MLELSDEHALSHFCNLGACRTLDIGCGTGSLLRFLRDSGAVPTGIECNRLQLDAAKQAGDLDGITIIEGVGQDLPFDDESYDLVIFKYSLHHVPIDAQDEALREAARVLAPDGVLYVAEPMCEGSGFEVHAPVDDETEVRTAALAALNRTAASIMAPAGEHYYLTRYHYRRFEDLKEEMIRIDPARAPVIAEKEAAMRDLFDEVGVAEVEGVRFDQPVRVNMYRKESAK